MRIPIPIDYCILKNPISKTGYIIFITKRGLEYVDETIAVEPEYNNITQFFNMIGFSNIETGMFESSMLEESPKLDKKTLIETLNAAGARYSKKLEINTKVEIEKIKKDVELVRQIMVNSELMSSINSKKEELKKNTNINPLHNNLFKFIQIKDYKIPEVGEQIKIYFYLFLDCKYDDNGNVGVMLSGDLTSKKNKTFRNFLKITESDFVRVESNSDTILLKSVKSHKNLLSDVNILKECHFEMANPTYINGFGYFMQQNTYTYNLIQILDKISSSEKISIELTKKDFNKLVVHSKLIKKEKEIEKRNYIKINIKTKKIFSDIIKLKKSLKEKMQKYSELEEYENAARMRDKIKILMLKSKELKKFGLEIETKTYDKIFSF